MFWQNLLFAFVAPIVLAAIVAGLITGIGMTLLATAAITDEAGIGQAFGAALGLHGHEVGKGLAVLVALIMSAAILFGASILSKIGPAGPRSH
jgi:hypothetical protein